MGKHNVPSDPRWRVVCSTTASSCEHHQALHPTGGTVCCTSVFCGVGGGAPVRGHGCHTHDTPALGRHRPGDNDTGSCVANVVVTRGSATATRGSCVAEEFVAHGRGDSQRNGRNQRRKTRVWGGGVLPAEKWNKKRRKNQQCKPRCFGAHTA